MGLQRLSAAVVLGAAAGWRRGRPLRHPQHLCRRHRGLRSGLDRVRPRADAADIDLCPRDPGPWGRLHGALEPRHHRPRLSQGRARWRHRHLVVGLGVFHHRRPGDRRAGADHAGGLELAAGVCGQPAARHRRPDPAVLEGAGRQARRRAAARCRWRRVRHRSAAAPGAGPDRRAHGRPNGASRSASPGWC